MRNSLIIGFILLFLSSFASLASYKVNDTTVIYQYEPVPILQAAPQKQEGPQIQYSPQQTPLELQQMPDIQTSPDIQSSPEIEDSHSPGGQQIQHPVDSSNFVPRE